MRKYLSVAAAFIAALLVGVNAGAQGEQPLLGNISVAPGYSVYNGSLEGNEPLRTLTVTFGAEMNFGHFQVRSYMTDGGMRFGKILNDDRPYEDVILFDVQGGYRIDLGKRFHVIPFAGLGIDSYSFEETGDISLAAVGGLRLSCDLFWRIGIFAEGGGRYAFWSQKNLENWRFGNGYGANAGLYFRL